MNWTQERVETLKKLWAQGLSASLIASCMGGVTRNAVIGKVCRLRLPQRKSRECYKPQRKPLWRERTVTRAPKSVPTFIPVAEPIPAHSDVARVDFEGLEPHHCRWPVGEPGKPGFGFCGHSRAEGLPYCAGHAQRAYVPIAVKPRPPARVRPEQPAPATVKELLEA
jgi:GcrA cell cycle regulator